MNEFVQYKGSLVARNFATESLRETKNVLQFCSIVYCLVAAKQIIPLWNTFQNYPL
jgi:hypothetical protein